MNDLFSDKNIKPMLIGVESEPFDNSEYIYELKLDGERCIAYLDENGTDLRNKRNIKMLPKVPELSNINLNVNNRCILDGELAVIKEGKPNFYEIQRRSMMSNPVKIDLASKKYPACFTAFDILYYKNKQMIDLPLMERKKLLQEVVYSENSLFSISRFIEEKGIAFYNLTVKQELEGIVAKCKDSKYYFEKRTKDWIKIKYLKDDDFIICGYIRKDNNMNSIILGKYEYNSIKYHGHITLGVSGEVFHEIFALSKTEPYIFPIPKGNEEATWVEPLLVCTVKFMMKTEQGGMRQPVFKGIRKDKNPYECREPT